ncbi:MAG TPA: PVC-type heme-binding CxxCH protein [Gemmataceae bacterium]|nr:PVC-type heme-binding CxxCH protein [Gemmataceae bacterium]
MSRKALLWTVAVLGVAALGVAAWFHFRPTRDEGPADGPTGRLVIHKGDRVVIVGNALAERMQYFGHFETLLHGRFPDHELVVRNLGYAGDAVTFPFTRAIGFFDHGHRLEDHQPDVLIACFGFNESFAGPGGLQQFEEALDKYVTGITTTAYNGHAPPRLALVSPIVHENLGRPGLPDGRANNENLRRYTDAMRRVAAHRGVVFVDLFAASQRLMAGGGPKLTINGVHLSDAGDKQIADALDEGLFGPPPTGADRADSERLRAAVNEKNLQFWYDYRATNGNFIYGGHKEGPDRNRWPAEFAKLRRMIANRDRQVWAVARGEAVPDRVNDLGTGELPPVETGLKDPPRPLTPDEQVKSFTLAPGFEVNLFASETDFPDLKKPVAMAFDARGRLWVTTMPSYPMYLPGEPVNDKLLILEDPAGTGKATKATVFADGLYLPTGLALGDGGAYVGCQPNVWFLKDTTGAGIADHRERILLGFGNADSNRGVNNFRWGPGGGLYFNEGVFNYAQVETPYGLRRNFNAAVYRYEPRTEKLDVHVTYKFGNPWGHAWDRWGQEFVADAADGACYYATAFSGQTDYPRKHPEMKTIFPKEWRPPCGCVLVSSSQFPDDWQGDFLLNNTMNRLPPEKTTDWQSLRRFKLREDGSGFTATPADPLLISADPNFRPVDVRFGPDGALYVCDWYNPIINYLVYSLRDPNRDRTRGRIWRITAKGRPLVPKPTVAGASVAELLELLKAPEEYTRDQAKRELRLHDTREVTAALERWVAGIDAADTDYPHQLLEALWVCQHHDAVNEDLLKRLLRSPEPRARAAATRVLCAWRDRVPDVTGLLRAGVNDEHPRVRLEAVRALSFFHGKEAREVATEARKHPMDYYLDYALNETLATLDGRLGP